MKEQLERKAYTVKEVAQMCAMSPNFIRSVIKDGTLTAFNVGGKYWVKPEALDAFLNKGKHSTPVQPRKEIKGDKKRVDETVTPKKKYGEFQNVLLTDTEYQKLQERFNSHLPEMIERLSAGIESKGYKYKSHYATILNWERNKESKNGNGTNRGGVENNKIPHYDEPPVPFRV